MIDVYTQNKEKHKHKRKTSRKEDFATQAVPVKSPLTIDTVPLPTRAQIYSRVCHHSHFTDLKTEVH